MIKKKIKKIEMPSGNLVITGSKNNIFVAVTKDNYEVIKVFSCGSCGFKNTKKGTPYSVRMVGNAVLDFLKEISNKIISVTIKGPYSIIDQFVTHMSPLLSKNNIKISSLEHKLSVRYGGCRYPKKRSV